MKQIIPLLILLFITSPMFAQTEVDLSVGAGYANQSYYSLENGEVENSDNTNWDIAFSASPFGWTILTNGGFGTELRVFPDGDISDWGSIDTTGLSTWPVLYNSDKDWGVGAFNQNSTSDEDLGWGIYNPITHLVVGDSLYILKLASGDFKKIWIINLAGGVFNFKYADLDGSNEVETQFLKTNYDGERFGYYSFANDEFFDREPASDTWDIVFGKYIAELLPNTYYGVTGALTNTNVKVAKAYPVDDPFEYSDYMANPYDTVIDAIGHDWKYFNLDLFQYSIEDSTCYFVNTGTAIWRVTFTSYAGTSSGDLSFEKEFMVEVVGIDEADPIQNLVLYPNPVSDVVNLVYETQAQNTRIEIMDLQGKILERKTFVGSGFQQRQMDMSGYTSGIYLLNVSAGQSQVTRKLIVE